MLAFTSNVDLTIDPLVILLSRECFLVTLLVTVSLLFVTSDPSGYRFKFSLSIALLVIVLGFLFQLPSELCL